VFYVVQRGVSRGRRTRVLGVNRPGCHRSVVLGACSSSAAHPGSPVLTVRREKGVGGRTGRHRVGDEVRAWGGAKTDRGGWH
jgi:hypothetical protein